MKKQTQTTSQATTNQHAMAQVLNKYALCEYTLTVEQDTNWSSVDFDAAGEYCVKYGFEQGTRLWNPKTQSWEQLDPDKFSVTAENFATAKREFWDRFNIYSQRRFGYKMRCVSTYVQPNAKSDTYTSFTRHSRNNGAQ